MPPKLRAALGTAARAAGLLLGCIAAGYLLLVLVYCLPTGRMQAHVRQAAVLLQNEGQHPQLAPGYDSTYLDNYSDAVMLKEALYAGPENPWQKAAGSYLAWGEEQVATLLGLLAGDDTLPVYSYSRYWHGYLVALKPLLLVFDLGELRLLNGAAQLLLLALVAARFARGGHGELVPPLLLTWLLLTPQALAVSMPYSNAYYTALLAILAVLRLPAEAPPRRLAMVLLLAGSLTCYCDLISYPVFTLGAPLAIYLLWRPQPRRGQLLALAGGCLGWGFGYAGMWLGKWLIAAAFTGPGALAEAWATVRLRAGAATEANEALAPLAPLLRNVGVYARPLYLVLAAGASLGYIAWALHKKRPLRRLAAAAPPLALVACLPLLWYLVTPNHSWEHWFFTHRNLAVCGLCWFGLLAHWAAPGPEAAKAAQATKGA